MKRKKKQGKEKKRTNRQKAKGRKKKTKNNIIRAELIFLIITILFSLFGIILIQNNEKINNMITGFSAFSIYPEEPPMETQPIKEGASENIGSNNETFTTPVIKEPIKEVSESASSDFGIQPIENLSVQLGKEGGFGILPNETISLKIMEVPMISSIVLNSTDPTLNDTNQNLTCWSVSNSSVSKSIFNWYKNNISTMQLYTPFEANGSQTTVTKDYSGLGNDCVVQSAVFSSTSGYDVLGAYNFDGINDGINCSATIDDNFNTTGFTISAWINTSTLTGTQGIIGTYDGQGTATGDGIEFRRDGKNMTIMLHDSGGGTYIGRRAGGNDISSTNTWYHVVTTWNGTLSNAGFAIYINGIRKDTLNISANVVDSYDQSGDPLRIGILEWGASYAYFNGTIDEVRIYNYSLSANQIMLLYQNSTHAIHSDETATGDFWKCSVTPLNSTEEGASTNSSELEILIARPTITSIYITSDDNTKNSTIVNLTGTFGATEPYGNLILLNETKWYNNSIEETKLRNFTLVLAGNTTRAENWMFSARTYSTDWSLWYNSSNFTILNAAPTHTNPILNSTNPTLNDTDQNLTCLNRSTVDADNDNVINIYNWYLNNNSILMLNLPFENSSNDLTTDYSPFTNPLTNYSISKNKVTNFTYYSKFNITVDPTLYLAFPEMVRANDGGLLLAYYNGTGHSSDKADVLVIKSTDNGTTWGSPIIVGTRAGADIDARNPALHVTSNGTVLLSYDIKNTTANKFYNVSYKLSGDNGATWDSEKQLASTNYLMINTVSHYIDLNNITYVSLCGTLSGVTTSNIVCSLWRSNNNAANFSFIANISDITTETDLSVETSLINLDSTGTYWLVLFRSAGATTTYSKTSSDSGATWSSLNDITSQVDVVQDPNLDWVVPYKVMLLTGRDKTNKDTVAWFSLDNGTTWTNKTIIDDYNIVSDGGYSSSVINGFPSPYTGLTVFYSDRNIADYPDIQGKYFTLNSEIINRTGKIGNSYYMNNRKYLSITNNAQTNLTNAFSVLFWIYLNPNDQEGKTRYIISKSNTTISQNGYYIAYDDINYNNSIRFTVFGDTGTKENTVTLSNNSINSEAWYHIAATWSDSLGSKIYLNSILNNTNSSALTLGTNNFNLQIANMSAGNTTFENIRIDELKLYNRTLSPEQISQIYNSENSRIASNTLISNETTTGDFWKCEVTPNDGVLDGFPLNSSELQILNTNTAPTLQLVHINSTDNTKNDTLVNLTGTFGTTDIDSDAMVLNETKWFNNSAEVTNLANFTYLRNGNTTHFENWRFDARTYDGTEWSLWYNTSNFTILNTAPTLQLFHINSTDSTKNNTDVNLTGTFGTTDLDSDIMVLNETKWFNGSVEVTGLRNHTLLLNGNTTRLENWRFDARTYDGTEWSLWYNTSNFTILNTVPTLQLVHINSTDNTKNDTNVNLTGTFGTTDLDSDIMVLNETKWFNNSAEETTLRNFTLVLAGNTTKNDNWRFDARTYDGYGWSLWYNTSNFTILNTAPTVNIPGIAPYPAYTNDTLNCSTYVYDINLDTLSVNFSWYNGSVLKYSTKKPSGVQNISDGFSANAIGSSSSLGIDTNGSDFWIVDSLDLFVYHVDSAGNNITDGFSTSGFGADSPRGITTNNSDFWILDNTDLFVYHVNRTGSNITDGFSTSGFGADSPRGITTNNSDFWILDDEEGFVYHTNRTGSNITDGFSISDIVSLSQSITTNNSDFWITDSWWQRGDYFVYHFNRTGSNMNDGFSTLTFGSSNPRGITTNNTDFWITDSSDKFVYHVIYSTITNGSLVSDILTSGLQNKNETWNCSVLVNDGSADGLSQSNTTTINNTRPQVDLILPENATLSTDRNTTFYYNVTDLDNIIRNCTLWLSSENSLTLLLNQTNSSALAPGLNSTFNVANLSVGYHTWMISCEDDESAETNSSIRYYTINNDAPQISLVSPENSTSDNYINTFTYNVSDQDPIVNCSLVIGGLIDQTDTTISKNASQTFQKTFGASGEFLWSVNCTDNLNTQNASEIRKLTVYVNVPVQPAPAPGSSSGSGSSGGAKSSISEIEQTATGIVYTIPSLITPITITPEGSLQYITSIVIIPSRETSNVRIKVEELSNIPTEKPGEDIIKFIRISTENLPDYVLYEAKINFIVPKSEINSRIELQHYSNGQWIKLPTKLVSSDDSFNYYESTTNSLSYFAITTQKPTYQEKTITTRYPRLIEKIGKTIKLTKEDIILYAVLPLTIIALLLTLMVRFVYKKLVNHKALRRFILIGVPLIIFGLFIPLEKDILIYLILPLSIIIFIFYLIIHFIIKSIKRKEKR